MGIGSYENKGLNYGFSAKVYQYPSSKELNGWIMVSLQKDLSIEIRNNFKWLEEVFKKAQQKLRYRL